MNTIKKHFFIIVIVSIYCAILSADIVLRFSTATWPYFRAWEYMGRRQAFGSEFIANARYEKDNVRGGLAAHVEGEQYTIFKKELFTTDRYGFRNNDDIFLNDEVPIFAFGDSFMIGAAVQDHETFPVQLQEQLGVPVYNAATGGIEDLLVGYFPVREYTPTIALYGLLEKLDYSLSERTKKKLSRDMSNPLIFSLALLGKRVDYIKDYIEDWISTSSLRRWYIQYRRYYLKSMLGSLWESTTSLPVLTTTVQNGDFMLFFTPAVKHMSETALREKRRKATEYVTALSQACRKNDMTFLIVLIPNKYTIYKPYLVPEDQVAINEDYLPLLEQDLKQQGIHVVNLLTAYKKAAKKLYPEGEYIYWQDDTHWNPEGIRIAAREVTRYIARANLLEQ